MRFTLPKAADRDGQTRAVGVEIELGGLSEAQVASIISECLHGTVEERAGKVLEVKDTSIGDLEVYLDTAYRNPRNPLLKKAVDIGRSVIPIEIVTDPIPYTDLPQLDTLVRALRAAGAEGTQDHLLTGYGVHLNVSVPALTAEKIVPVVRAFALIEDWLRGHGLVDVSRRVLPFVERYPRAFLDAVAHEARTWSLADLMRVYLEKTPSRNRALDLLPLLREIDEDAVVAALGGDASAVKARPTYHYRLPDSRVGEDGWSLQEAWSTWCLVEQVAARPDLLDRLSGAWIDYRSALTTTPADWIGQVDAMLQAAFGAEAFR
jgi:hypothetical protein